MTIVKFRVADFLVPKAEMWTSRAIVGGSRWAGIGTSQACGIQPRIHRLHNETVEFLTQGVNRITPTKVV